MLLFFFQSLIDGSSSRGLILGAGALAGRYCREHKCENKAEFNTLISKLAAPLGSACKPKDKADENKIIASLKAIHNIHHLNEATAKIVSTCASEASLPTRIRVFALEAFHGDACIPKVGLSPFCNHHSIFNAETPFVCVWIIADTFF